MQAVPVPSLFGDFLADMGGAISNVATTVTSSLTPGNELARAVKKLGADLKNDAHIHGLKFGQADFNFTSPGKGNSGKGNDGKGDNGKGNSGKGNNGKGNSGKGNNGKDNGKDHHISWPSKKGNFIDWRTYKSNGANLGAWVEQEQDYDVDW